MLKGWETECSGEKWRGTGEGFPLSEIHARVLDRVQVNAPYRLLVDKYLDLFLEYGINPEIGLDAAFFEQADRESMERLAHLFAKAGRTITLHGPFMDLAPGGLDERIREVSASRMQRTMELAPLFTPQSVVFHAGYDDRRYHAQRQQWLSRSLATWEPLTRQAEDLGVVIHLENVYERTPDMILALIQAISSENLGFCLDVGHMNAFADTPLVEWLSALGPYLKEIHLHDNDGQRDAHAPIGSGTAPFGELFQYLSDRSVKPVLTLEPHAEASLWRSLENLEQLWPWDDESTTGTQQ
jgi:sugar phosphate isomerase/epimerase